MKQIFLQHLLTFTTTVLALHGPGKVIGRTTKFPKRNVNRPVLLHARLHAFITACNKVIHAHL